MAKVELSTKELRYLIISLESELKRNVEYHEDESIRLSETSENILKKGISECSALLEKMNQCLESACKE